MKWRYTPRGGWEPKDKHAAESTSAQVLARRDIGCTTLRQFPHVTKAQAKKYGVRVNARGQPLVRSRNEAIEMCRRHEGETGDSWSYDES